MPYIGRPLAASTGNSLTEESHGQGFKRVRGGAVARVTAGAGATGATDHARSVRVLLRSRAEGNGEYAESRRSDQVEQDSPRRPRFSRSQLSQQELGRAGDAQQLDRPVLHRRW